MTRKTVLLLSVAAVPIVLAAAFAVRLTMREVDAVARESSQRALLVEIQGLLADYRKAHDVYPDTLATLPLTYPDGSAPELLQDIQYEVTQDGYVLRTRGNLSREVLEVSEQPGL